VLISRSTWRKLLATVVVAIGFVWLFQARIRDSHFSLPLGFSGVVEPLPQPGQRLLFSATAYCKGTTTTSGVNVRSGIAAADPDLLPVGSVVQVDAPGDRHDGVYTIMDTGPRVQGRHLDLYMWSCKEALAFGRTGVSLTVLRLGWNPQASSPGIIDRLFRHREATAPPPPPLPVDMEKQIPPSSLPGPDDAAETPGTKDHAVPPVPEIPKP
jgi:3D (Asp-Asp-Asp) domain-containing protein